MISIDRTRGWRCLFFFSFSYLEISDFYKDHFTPVCMAGPMFLRALIAQTQDDNQIPHFLPCLVLGFEAKSFATLPMVILRRH